MTVQLNDLNRPRRGIEFRSICPRSLSDTEDSRRLPRPIAAYCGSRLSPALRSTFFVAMKWSASIWMPPSKKPPSNKPTS